jgi:hypothetical protein
VNQDLWSPCPRAPVGVTNNLSNKETSFPPYPQVQTSPSSVKAAVKFFPQPTYFILRLFLAKNSTLLGTV